MFPKTTRLKNEQRIDSVLYKEFFYTKRTEGSLNIIQLSRGICTLSILYFWLTTLLKQTAFPFQLLSIFWHSYFQKVAAQSGVVVLVQTSLIPARASEVKLDPLTLIQNERDTELKDVASQPDKDISTGTGSKTSLTRPKEMLFQLLLLTKPNSKGEQGVQRDLFALTWKTTCRKLKNLLQ